MTDTLELEKRMKQLGYTKKFVAESMGMSRFTLSKKLKNVSEFKASEIKKLEEFLELPDNTLFFKDNGEYESPERKNE